MTLADYTGPLKLPTGYVCACGRTHRFPVYVYAQTPQGNVDHECECGRVNTVYRGSLRVELGKPPKGTPTGRKTNDVPALQLTLPKHGKKGTLK